MPKNAEHAKQIIYIRRRAEQEVPNGRINSIPQTFCLTAKLFNLARL